mmetsp:Transcript_9487/g.15329  ORF Transcript_9487/g.15329 Transcript_9487/m.15329 type:complete len:107 (+) Transcript_9487:234-554(+)
MQSKSKAESSSNMNVCVISGELTEDKKQPTPQSKAEDFSSRSMNKIEDVKSTASKVCAICINYPLACFELPNQCFGSDMMHTGTGSNVESVMPHEWERDDEFILQL